MKTLIIIGGFVWIGFFVFHIYFWKFFDWKNDLENLYPANKSIMQILNLCLMLVMLLFSYVSIFHTIELLTSSLGKTILVGITAFGVFRIILQFIFFDIRQIRSKVFLLMASLGTSLYLIPFISLL